MRILFSTTKLSNGGAERQISLFANELVKRNIDVGMIIEQQTEDEFYLDERVSVFRLQEQNTFVYRLIEIYSIIKEFNPTILVPFLLTASIHMFIPNLFIKKKYIFCVRNNPWYNETYREKFKQLLSNIICFFSDGILVQNLKQSEYFGENYKKKIFVVSNVIDDSFLNHEREKRKKIETYIAVGRLEKQKNHKLLINAFNEALKHDRSLKLEIYGVGYLQDELQDLINEYKINDRVFLVGRSNNISEKYKKADAFILSSDYEGLPNALLEAFAMGVPCISTDCLTGPSDIIDNNKDGILVKPQNEKQLTKAILKLAHDVDLANSFSQVTIEKSKRLYNKQKIADDFVEALERIM